MSLEFTLEDGATAPTRGTPHAAGIDLYASEDFVIDHTSFTQVRTGVRMKIPEGYLGLICDRSGNGLKKNIQLFRGVIDSDYRGEIIVGAKLLDETGGVRKHSKGFKIAQMLILPVPAFALTQVDALDETERGSAGFGSTDAK